MSFFNRRKTTDFSSQTISEDGVELNSLVLTDYSWEDIKILLDKIEDRNLNEKERVNAIKKLEEITPNILLYVDLRFIEKIADRLRQINTIEGELDIITESKLSVLSSKFTLASLGDTDSIKNDARDLKSDIKNMKRKLQKLKIASNREQNRTKRNEYLAYTKIKKSRKPTP